MYCRLNNRGNAYGDGSLYTTYRNVRLPSTLLIPFSLTLPLFLNTASHPKRNRYPKRTLSWMGCGIALHWQERHISDILRQVTPLH